MNSSGLATSEEADEPADDESSAGRAELPGNLAGLTVWQQVCKLAIWPFLEQLLNFCVGFVDTAIAGRLSVAATEAIAVGAYIGWLLSLMFGVVGIGAGALVSRGIGGRHRREARAALGQAFVAAMIVGLGLAVAVWFLCPLIATTMNLVDESHAMAVDYLRWMAVGTPLLGIMFTGASCLRSAGDTRTPFLVFLAVNVVNVAASLTLVYGPPQMGSSGIALGTTLAWSVGAILVVVQLTRRKSVVRLFWHRLRPRLAVLQRIFRVSGPQFFDSLALWTGNFILATMVGYIGRTEQPGALAAHIVAIRIEAISFLPGWAMGQAAATLMGQYLGLGDPDRANLATRYCWFVAATLMGFMGLLFLLVPEFLVGLMTAQPILLDLAPPILSVCGVTQVFFASVLVLENAVRGAGDTRPVALRVMFSTFGVRLPAAYIAGMVLHSGVRGVWVAMCGELVFRSILITTYFLRGDWRKTRV